MKKKYWVIVICLLILFDQLTKWLVVKYIDLNSSLVIIKNFFKLCYIKNTGISFGLLSNQGIIIILLSVLIIGYMIYEFIKTNNKCGIISSSLIISGALGNLIDRLFRGYVVDFFSFTIFKKEMAIFNVADSFITIGVIIYIIVLFMEGKNERIKSKK